MTWKLSKSPFRDERRSKLDKHLKKLHDKAFKHLDHAGRHVGKASSKLGVENFWPGPMPGEILKATRILQMMTEVDQAPYTLTSRRAIPVPPRMIQQAEGLAIFTVFRTGLVWSAAGGSGIVISRNPDRSWGAPSGILVHTIGYGFLAGADIYNVVLILRNRKAVKAFSSPKVSLGAELTVTAGDMGGGAMVETGIEAAPVVSYVKGKGLYGGIQLDGNIILERKNENERFYKKKVKASELLGTDESSRPSGSSSFSIPSDVEPLHRILAAIEGRIPIIDPASLTRDRFDSPDTNTYVPPIVREQSVRIYTNPFTDPSRTSTSPFSDSRAAASSPPQSPNPFTPIVINSNLARSPSIAPPPLPSRASTSSTVRPTPRPAPARQSTAASAPPPFTAEDERVPAYRFSSSADPDDDLYVTTPQTQGPAFTDEKSGR